MANVWSDGSQQPIVTIVSGTSTNVITDSTRRLQQCLQEQLIYLDNRARALATCAHFEAALKDATTMQQLDPSSAAGYLCAGHVYSLQGREKAAIEIYDQGLAAVPSSDPSYQPLVDARSIAQEKDRKVIDFIKEFPVDIIEHIASKILSTGEKMAPSELGGYLGVSRVWREKLLLGVQRLDIECTTKDDLAYGALLEHVAPYCTCLTLGHEAIGFTRLLPKAHFHSLRSLVLLVDCDYTAELSRETLASLPSLTHLTIKAYETNLTLGDILNSCPQLVYLHTECVDHDVSTAPEFHSRLKSLLLWEYLSELDIPAIIKRLPALEVFVANPFYYSENLKVVQDHCPNLKLIGCNDYDRYHHETTISSDNDDDGTAGVHTFVIDYDEEFGKPFHAKHVMNFMIRNRHTLQNIHFWPPGCGDVEENDPSDTPILSHAIQATANDNHDDQFNQMTRYTQYISHQDDILMARWAARKSPHLKEVELVENDYNGVNIEIDIGAFFDDLIGLCDLETLKISLNLDVSMDMGSIERFIQYHSTFDSQLHTLVLPKNTRLSMEALDALATLPRLKHLSIHFPLVQDDEDDPDGEHFPQFIHQLAVECPRLEYLKIVFHAAIADKIFLRLSELQYQQLLDARSMAQDKDSKCIDFIKKLPLDTIQNIAPRILSEEEIEPSELDEYLGVSYVWREKLLLGVQKLHIRSTTEDDLGDNDELLEQVAPYCTGLTIHYRATGFPRLMSKAYFHSLRKLVLYTPWDNGVFTQDPKEALASLCPHLVYLNASDIDPDMSTAPECHPRLKRLVLSDDDGRFDIHGITKRLPALQVFSAYPFEESKDFKIVQDNCPNLKVIGCNHDTWYGHVPYTSSDDQDPHVTTIDVHTLHVGYYICFSSPLGGGDTDENDPSNTPILSHAIQATTYDNHDDRFNQMTRYTQFIYYQECLRMARWVARKSPHLKELKLERMPETADVDIDTSALFDDLIGLCELETLTIGFDTDSSMDMGGIERFIRYHSTFDSQLHTLTLPKNTRLSMDVLELLATLPRLENLCVHLPLVQDDTRDGEHFSQFIHHLAMECSLLERLEISFDGPIHDNIFLELSELQVTWLELHMPFYIDKLPIGLLCLLRCPQLQELDVVRGI
ncbi:hypothetical protein K492DRAFT_209002 [Lichtheimia hyalospora FSU 10163]|nr:hypothetical protein K492DRAFT_209002 [Lichtheimia hyalospora FSU 10163]